MKIKLIKGRPESKDNIASFEAELGRSVPIDFSEFVQTNDGAELETNIFDIGDGNESGVNGFIPISQIHNEMRNIENLPPHAFPVAWAEGGNYVLIKQGMNSGVYFWDHERPESMTRLAENFSSFLGVLKPFDISSINLKPGQVMKAWIDPDFLKKMTPPANQ
ncbi:MAG: SMI1/KNR4 family protein [Verrucomicrobiota bacterium]